MKVFIFSALIGLSLISCKAKINQNIKSDINTESVDTNNVLEDTMTLSMGESKSIESHKLNITFDSITEDSRCPKDVQCIWSGVAKAKITFSGYMSRPRTAELATLENPAKGFTNTTIYHYSKITLIEVSPQKQKNQKIVNYKIKLKIEKK